MKPKQNIVITIFCLIVISFVLIGISRVEHTKAKETKQWINQVTKTTRIKENSTYTVKKVLSVKRPLTDELDSISSTFFKEEVTSINIRVIEALIKKDDQEMYVDIVADVEDSSNIEKLHKVSGILINNKEKKKHILINAQIK